jgi:hypothetical protein
VRVRGDRTDGITTERGRQRAEIALTFVGSTA